ncbi:4-hydroxy-tetrahydrodipicolinate synthase [Demequina aurantiaca]|uniref:4-hydroxy-tetrahydrodipicolinate synthase n=1 Tax=Demequina aurantiaca TaxID=676200 RepID=UPI003D325C8B
MTSAQRPFGTVLTAMVTPMFDDGSIDLEGAQRLAKYLVDHGSDGLVISGTTGEAPTTHAPEKEDLTRAIVEAVGDRAMVVAGAGSNDTAHAVMMAAQAQECGAHGILALTPYYSKPSQAGVVAHFNAICDASDLPVMIYDIPGRTALAIGDDAFDKISQLPTVKALKDATGDVAQAKSRIERSDVAWYSGDDPLTLEFMRVGAVGVVSVVSHVAGEWVRDMIAAHDAGNTSLAEELNERTSPVTAAIMSPGPGATMAKAGMQALGVLSGRHMRLPLLPATSQEYDSLTAALVAAGLKN